MLAITCNDEQKFRMDLGDGRWVNVTCEMRHGGNQVRLLITAPDSVRIYRDKLWLKIVSERFLNVLTDVPQAAFV